MKSKLSQIADTQRVDITKFNVYRFDGTNQYSSRHPNAISGEHGADDPADIKGKGNNDGDPYEKGGGSLDIYGSPLSPGSGRIGNLVKNSYTKDNPYPYTGIE